MPDVGFLPLSPRRLHRPCVIAVADDRALPEDGDCAQPVASESGEQSAPMPDAVDTNRVADDVEKSAPALPCAEPDAMRVRTAAIELAAAACARALHYAVDRNPRLLARFVDDALRAAGSPPNATVRVAASSMQAASGFAAHDFVTAAGLVAGDVFVECADGTLGATIDERAARLVRAAAT